MKNWIVAVTVSLLVVGFAAWEGGATPVPLDLLAALAMKTDKTGDTELGEIWSNCGI